MRLKTLNKNLLSKYIRQYLHTREKEVISLVEKVFAVPSTHEAQ